MDKSWIASSSLLSKDQGNNLKSKWANPQYGISPESQLQNNESRYQLNTEQLAQDHFTSFPWRRLDAICLPFGQSWGPIHRVYTLAQPDSR